MADPRGFLTVLREKERERATTERVQDWREVTIGHTDAQTTAQASRCMDCGIPFCHQGCPLGNLIPEWNDLVYRGELDEATRRLLETNNFPEVTGRVCPAPCEASCVLSIEGAPVTIKAVERMLGERARASMSLAPAPRRARTDHTVAVIGSGPAGLATAQQLARAGHDVTVFERDDRIGGLLRYGIPDFKLEKGLLDERIAQMRAEGVVFRTGVHAGVDVTGESLRRDFDRVVLAGGARKARALQLEGASLGGVHYAMDFLTQQNRRVAGLPLGDERDVVGRGKAVVVLGGGDTGADCVGTSIRQGARSVLQLELMPQPPLARVASNPWPEWPLVFRSSTSHDEGCSRDWAVSTRALLGNDGHVTSLEAVRVELTDGQIRELEGSRFSIPCDLVLLAMGFVGPEVGGLVSELGVTLDERGNVRTDATGRTSVENVFATGDMSRGQSLVVWAIADGRRVAAGVDASLRAPKTI